MRRQAAKKSRRRNGSGGPVSLFPFLAVLICTMGSLILLLVVIARQARLQAAEQHEPDEQEFREEFDREFAMAELVAGQLEASRDATEGDLLGARAQLGQIEDHSSELRRQLADFQAAWRQLDQLESGARADRDETETELAALSAEIGRLKLEVEEAKQKAAEEKPAYSIVPYEGPNGTRRRPIYIECRADGLVLQPEGVYFGADDFEGPLDAGNPLDVALRSVREYLTAQQGLLGSVDQPEPYPLLLVRPSGIAYFYAGRAAMKSWGTEFGYELIGDDWELDFPTPDPVLARSIAEAVEPARQRQRMVMAAAPSRYGGGSDRPVYTVRPYRGGVASRGGGGDEGDGQSPLSLRSEPPEGRFGNRFGGQQPGDGQPGGGQPAERSTAHAENGATASGGSPGSTSEPCQTSGANALQASPGQKRELPESLAKTRGRNWGLPDASRSAVAITRPIRIECFADRMTIVPERGLGDPQTISLENGVSASIDGFVSAVWDYMELWGKAGRGMYWRPSLNVHVGPGAYFRLAELEFLLRDSGLLVTEAGRLTTLP